METDLVMDIRKKYGSAFDKVAIGKAAEEFRKGIGIDKPQFQFRFPVVTVLEKMGFQLFRGTFEDPAQSGLIAVDSSLPDENPIYEKDRAVFVNKNDSIQHQRFTIAHELAHYIFDYDESVDATYYKSYLTSEADDEVEKRANRFAAELLMPAKRFREEYDKYVGAQGELFSLPSTISHLSELFNVPAKSVRFRLSETQCKNPQNGRVFTNEQLQC